MGGDQYKRSGQVETGGSNSPNQIAEDGRTRGKTEETQVGILVWGVGGTGRTALPGEPGGQVAQGVEGAEEGA